MVLYLFFPFFPPLENVGQVLSSMATHPLSQRLTWGPLCTPAPGLCVWPGGCSPDTGAWLTERVAGPAGMLWVEPFWHLLFHLRKALVHSLPPPGESLICCKWSAVVGLKVCLNVS